MKISRVLSQHQLTSFSIAVLFIVIVTASTVPSAFAATLSGFNVRVTTTNYQFDQTAGYGLGVGSTYDVFQQNEPSITFNPSDSMTLAVGVNDVRSLPVSGDAWQGLAFSTDGGATWTESLVPGYPGDTGCPSVSPICGNGAASDPYVGFDTQNNLFFAFIAFQRAVPAMQPGTTPAQANAIAVAKYEYDSGTKVLTYAGTAIVDLGTLGVGQQQDKDALAVDTSSSSQYVDNVYVSWTKFTGGFDHLYFARSTDHGESYFKPIKLDTGTPVLQGSSIAVAPDGTVYVAYRKYNTNPTGGTPQADAIYVVKSTNGGTTFSKPVRVDFIQSYDQSASRSPPVFRVDSFPSIAADENGVYVAWSNKNPTSGADVEVSRSTDQGTTWEAPVIPHSTDSSWGTNVGGNGNGHQIMPALAVAGGILSVVWYDSRTEPTFTPDGPVTNGTTTGMEVFYSQADTSDTLDPLSFDTPIAVTSSPFNPNLNGSILAYTPFIGDYIFVAANSTMAFVTWTDNRDINNANNINGQLYMDDDSLPCFPSSCTSLPAALVNQGAADSNVYFQAISK
jgi:hypothetical protein